MLSVKGDTWYVFEKKEDNSPSTLYSNILGLCDIVLILAGLGQQITSRQDQSADDSVFHLTASCVKNN